MAEKLCELKKNGSSGGPGINISVDEALAIIGGETTGSVSYLSLPTTSANAFGGSTNLWTYIANVQNKTKIILTAQYQWAPRLFATNDFQTFIDISVTGSAEISLQSYKYVVITQRSASSSMKFFFE